MQAWRRDSRQCHDKQGPIEINESRRLQGDTRVLSSFGVGSNDVSGGHEAQQGARDPLSPPTLDCLGAVLSIEIHLKATDRLITLSAASPSLLQIPVLLKCESYTIPNRSKVIPQHIGCNIS